MKAKIQSLQFLEDRARVIQDKLEKLEEHHRSMEEHIRDLMEESAILTKEAKAGGSAYAFERSSRLNHQLRDFQSKRGYDPVVYHSLNRQVRKILNSDLTHYMSQAMNRKLLEIAGHTGAGPVPEMDPPAPDSAPRSVSQLASSIGLQRTVVYQLSNMSFLVRGRIREELAQITYSELLEHLEQAYSKTIEIFPFPGPHIGNTDGENRASVIIVEEASADQTIALWYDTVVEISDKDFLTGRIIPPARDHRFIAGTVRKDGRAINVLQLASTGVTGAQAP